MNDDLKKSIKKLKAWCEFKRHEKTGSPQIHKSNCDMADSIEAVIAEVERLQNPLGSMMAATIQLEAERFAENAHKKWRRMEEENTKLKAAVERTTGTLQGYANKYGEFPYDNQQLAEETLKVTKAILEGE